LAATRAAWVVVAVTGAGVVSAAAMVLAPPTSRAAETAAVASVVRSFGMVSSWARVRVHLGGAHSTSRQPRRPG
jgi:hypothetical protein